MGLISERKAGALWLRGTPLDDLAARTMRDSRQNPAIRTANISGYDSWFCDFDQSHQYSVGANNTFAAPIGPFLVAESSPFVTATLNATAPNVNILPYWYRTDIGSPVSLHFWSDLAGGGDNELHSSVKLGATAVNGGTTVYQPFHNFGVSIGTQQKEFGFVIRARKQSGTIPTGAGFFGLASMLLSGQVLTSAGALSATALDSYFGFFVDTANAIWFVLNDAATGQFLVSTGSFLTTGFSVLEVRGFWDNGGVLAWQPGSFIDAYVNGVLVTSAAAREHTVTPSERAFTLSGGAGGLTPSMGCVKTSGASTNPLMQVDYFGSWHSRALALTTTEPL